MQSDGGMEEALQAVEKMKAEVARSHGERDKLLKAGRRREDELLKAQQVG